MIRKATESDIPGVSALYDDIHTEEESGISEKKTRAAAYVRVSTNKDDQQNSFAAQYIHYKKLLEESISEELVDVYADAPWSFDAPDCEVMVLHTLVISPRTAGKGYGRRFVQFYEDYALSHGCRYLRMDTNERNSRARAMYVKLGYKEIGIVPTVFNGIPGVGLVLLEKAL